MYDIIGDIHGYAEPLIALLRQLGYSQQHGVWRHPENTALFVGDLIDRGPRIREVIELIRRMTDAGSARVVMGNHEFNLLAYHTPDPDRPGHYLRPHTARNTQQIAETLDQLNSQQLHDALDWFRSLPFQGDFGGVRVVHACWDAARIAVLESARQACQGVTSEFMVRATRPEDPVREAIEVVLKGPEIDLPEGVFYWDRYGLKRRTMRLRWYRAPDPRTETYSSYSLSVDDPLPEMPFPAAVVPSDVHYPAHAPPVFFGHYWLRADQPTRLAPNVACVDYSVAKGGFLCGYRWRGESALDDSRFMTA